MCFCPTVSDSNCTRKYINDTDKFESALQAWQEYNPVRDEQYGQTGDSRTANEYKLYRYRTFGKDAAIFLLDTRSFRDDILPGTTLVSSELVSYALPPRRTMLGSAQLTDLLRDLREAQLEGITWKFVLVPEPIQNLTFVVASDRFEGYARERAQILDFIQSFCIENVVFTYGIDPVLPNGGDVPVVNRLRVDAATRKANGQVCGNDTACASCRCSAGFCAAGLDNGSVCLTDAQCNSDRCALQGLLLRCQPKLGNGAKCVNDNDCLAGDCALSVDPPGRRCWPVPD